MWRIFNRYDVPSAGYDGIPETLANAPLDKVEVAGAIRHQALLEITSRSKLKFAYALKALHDLETLKAAHEDC